MTTANPADSDQLMEANLILDTKLDWSPAPTIPPLEGVGVHVWAANLDSVSGNAPIFIPLLSADERKRADKFQAARDRTRFIVTRGTLRTILASYVEKAPAELKFDYGVNGKPKLAMGTEHGPLYFNLAHSENLLVIAMTHCSPLGIDVEQIRPIPDVMKVAEQFFSQSESIWLRTLPEGEQLEAFYKLWTCKEACLKATGEALSEMLPEIEAASVEKHSPRLLCLQNDSQAAARWTLEILKPSAGSTAALAAPVPELRLSCYQWPAENTPRIVPRAK